MGATYGRAMPLPTSAAHPNALSPKLRIRPIADIPATVLSSVWGSPMLQMDDLEHPVPEPWRSTFRQIADAFAAGDFQLRHHTVDGVEPLDLATAEGIAQNVAAYGDPLAALNDATWERSVYRWMDGYWQMLIDLTTEGEPVSDLTLHAKLHNANRPRLEISSVHVA